MADNKSELTNQQTTEKSGQNIENNSGDTQSLFKFFPEVLAMLRDGDATIEYRKRVLLRAIDEAWVDAIENTLGALDEVTRKPTRFIKEEEHIFPVELTRTITSRSIQHLSQHTDLIAKVEGDDVYPAKLLNVFREETILTYENRFVNTLINRLYTFVNTRYRIAKRAGADVKNTSMEFNETFAHGEGHAKIHLRIELEEPHTEEDEPEKNYLFQTDLWKRIERLNQICQDYASCIFVKQMGNNFIRPPVMRTNAILKNPYYRQCLALWEFISSYENVGYTTLVEDTMLNLTDTQIHEVYKSVAMQYSMFLEHFNKGFEEDEVLAKASMDEPLAPQIIEDISPATASEFALHIAKIDKEKNVSTADETDMLRALEIALLADEIMNRRTEAELKLDLYDRSFTARLILGWEPLQTFYSDIKNYLLSFKKAKSRVSWKGERFNVGRRCTAQLVIRGKTLILFLPLDPTTIDTNRYNIEDFSMISRFKQTPTALRIRSRRALKYAIELIDFSMQNQGIEKSHKAVQKDYHVQFMNRDELIKNGLIKMVSRRFASKKDEFYAFAETIAKSSQKDYSNPQSSSVFTRSSFRVSGGSLTRTPNNRVESIASWDGPTMTSGAAWVEPIRDTGVPQGAQVSEVERVEQASKTVTAPSGPQVDNTPSQQIDEPVLQQKPHSSDGTWDSPTMSAAETLNNLLKFDDNDDSDN